jgi:hypothetical protein
MEDNSEWTTVNYKKKNDVPIFKRGVFNQSKKESPSFTAKNDSKSRETLDNTVKKGISVAIQIRNITKPNISLETFIETFIKNYSHWMKPQFVENNKSLILKEASRNCRVDILGYLIREHPNFKRGALDRTFQPLNYCIWDQMDESIENIINTLEILLKFGYDIFNLYDNESILGSIVHMDNKTPNEKRFQIYDYITRNLEFSNFKLFLTDTFNKINEDNSRLYQNKILFLLTRFPRDFSQTLLKRIIEYQSITKLELHKSIDLISQIITSSANTDDKELDRYFDSINLKELQSDFIEKLISIELSEICRECDFMIIRFYCAFLGSIYKFSDVKREIITKISNYIKTKDSDFLKTFMIFLIHSDINIKNMSSSESELVNEYLKIFYINKNISDKLTVETNFGILLNESIDVRQLITLFPIIGSSDNYNILTDDKCAIDIDNEPDNELDDELDDESDEEKTSDNLSKILDIFGELSDSNIREIYNRINDLLLQDEELLLLILQSMYDLNETRAILYKKLLSLFDNNIFEKLNILVRANQEMIDEYKMDNLHIEKYIRIILN